MKKKLELKTKRLVISPMTDDEIRDLIAATEAEELKAAYGEMLDGCIRDPENRAWYAPWAIKLKKEGTHIGELGFKGPPVKHAVEIGYGIDEAFRGCGYATEACTTAIDWALGANEDVYFVEAEAEADNAASLRVIEKLGFTADGEGEEGPRFVKEKPETAWIAFYMCLGMSIGVSLGTANGSMATGMPIGLAIGLAIGAALDSSEKKKREKIRSERKGECPPTTDN